MVSKIIHFRLTRIILAALSVGLVVGGAQAIVVGVSQWLALKESAATAILYYALYSIIGILAARLTYQTYVRIVEKRPVTELSRPGAWREGTVGTLLGAGLMAATVGTLWLLGLYQVLGINSALPLVAALANDITGAFVEEIVLRAIVFRIVVEMIGSWWALFLSALLFAGLHLLNPGATLLGAIAVGLEASLLLSAAWLLTRRLWLAVGIHAGWDFVQDGILGAGATITGEGTQGLLQGQLTGPVWLSGGALGAEASLIALALVTVVGVYLLVLSNRQPKVATLDYVPSSHRD